MLPTGDLFFAKDGHARFYLFVKGPRGQLGMSSLKDELCCLIRAFLRRQFGFTCIQYRHVVMACGLDSAAEPP
jgi:hypothetical protein